MARLRRSHQAGKLGSRASMTSLTDVAEEEGGANGAADNQYASADEDEQQQQQQQQQHAVDGEWPPLANIKKFSTADEVHSGTFVCCRMEDRQFLLSSEANVFQSLSYFVPI